MMKRRRIGDWSENLPTRSRSTTKRRAISTRKGKSSCRRSGKRSCRRRRKWGLNNCV